MSEQSSTSGGALNQWRECGKEVALLFGRFQPLNAGQVGLIRLIQQSELDLHIVTNEKGNSSTESNPYNREQRIQMFALALPEITQRQQHFTTTYLDRGGDVAPAIKKLTKLFETIAPANKSVIFYVEKREDIKPYQLGTKPTPELHYVDLFLPPYGNFSKHKIDPSTIPSVKSEATLALTQYLTSLKPEP